jgi:serine/threonine-protein kinase
MRAADERVSARLDEAAALANAGKFQDALAAASAIVTNSEQLGSPATQARALFWLGRLQSFNGDSAASETTLELAMTRAAEAHDDALVADAGIELIYVLGYELARPAEALQAADLVTAMVRRAGADPSREGRLSDHIGVVMWAKRSFVQAQQHFERALALFGKVADADELVAATLTNLGNVLADQGKYEEARRQYERELAITERVHGAEHPQTARALANLGTVLQSLGHYDEAQRSFERALAIWEAAYGPEHPMIAMVTNNLGDLLVERGDPARALPYCQRAQAIGEATLPEGHPIRAYHLVCVGGALLALGRSAEAVSAYKQALALRTASDNDPIEIAETKFGLAKASWSAGTPAERREARELATAAREAYAAGGEQHHATVTEIDEWLRTHR